MKPTREITKAIAEHEHATLSEWATKSLAMELPPSRDQVIGNVAAPETAPTKRVKKHTLQNDPEVQYNIRITESVRQRLKSIVKREHRPMAELISEMVDAWEHERTPLQGARK